MENKIQVFAVIQIDSNLEVFQEAITIKAILPIQTDAENEVKRLNKLNSDKGARYFWQATRFLSGGLHLSPEKTEVCS